ncbi:MAG: hypothetical protein QM533_01795, partial [Cytophagales bacterium]|nr:hypothetical protein [Cytophagales bacterium]
AELPTAVGSSQAPTAVDKSVFHLFFGVHTLGTGSVAKLENSWSCLADQAQLGDNLDFCNCLS